MEVLVSPQAQKQSSQAFNKKNPRVGSQKDIWFVVREGSLADVDSALSVLKKSGGNINTRNIFGLTPLHIATWRNHIPIVRRLLAAGAGPDVRDGESGWSSLHRALHFGHLAVASILLQAGASITLEDSKSRTPVDLLSGPVALSVGEEQTSVATEVFCWGSGTNYQLGTGNEHVQKLPGKVDSLHGCFIKLVSAAKFHSVAVSSRGELYTWGFGRGGRLGHPDFDIHSGQAAVITPRLVTYGLGSRRVRAVAAAKHHTVLATEGGEVFTWGSNREGQLGYTSVDTQPTPRRVSSLKSKIVAVAAANKHTAAVSEAGEVFTWGCNREGQLGYGTSNSASNYTPRLVDYLKGRVFTAVSCAKYHTLVLGSDGEVYTWGHRLVTPKRVTIGRNLKKGWGALLKFHRVKKLHVTAIAAGMVHSMALTGDGALFYWASSDTNLKCHQMYSLCGKRVVSISAGKYWAAAVTVAGDVYMWDATKYRDKPPLVTRLHGLKRATSVSVGETHLMAVSSLYHPKYESDAEKNTQKGKLNGGEEIEELDEGFIFNNVGSDILPSAKQDAFGQRSVPSLKNLCEQAAAQVLVEPRNAIQLLEIADSLGADDLKEYCEDIVIRNLDFILTVSSQGFASASLDILADLEKLLDSRSSEPWSSHRLPTPTATYPLIIDGEEEDSQNDYARTRENNAQMLSSYHAGDLRKESFVLSREGLSQDIFKQVRALRKKLQQIEILEAKQSKGEFLDDQQVKKLGTKSFIESLLAELGVPVEMSQNKAPNAVSPDTKGNKKVESSKKQKRKGKQRTPQVEAVNSSDRTETCSISKSQDEITRTLKNKEEDAKLELAFSDQASKGINIVVQKKDNYQDLARSKGSLPGSTKKKNRKGGLSMFLSGALDEAPKPAPAPSPTTPKIEGPAWGGAKILKGSASLREIQDEQSKTELSPPVVTKSHPEDASPCKLEGKLLLSSFLPSKPIPVNSGRKSQACEEEKGPPSWASSGTPPQLCRPSLREIQMQEVKKQLQSLSHSPKTRAAGFAVQTGQSSPSDSPGLNRWFKPEVEAPSTIRAIQIEEKAMKDLRRFYTSVKVVRNQS